MKTTCLRSAYRKGGGQHPVTGVLYTVMPDVASIVPSVINVEK
jgi:hypothetical protein